MTNTNVSKASIISSIEKVVPDLLNNKILSSELDNVLCFDPDVNVNNLFAMLVLDHNVSVDDVKNIRTAVNAYYQNV